MSQQQGHSSWMNMGTNPPLSTMQELLACWGDGWGWAVGQKRAHSVPASRFCSFPEVSLAIGPIVGLKMEP